jgi:hypothetical protein
MKPIFYKQFVWQSITWKGMECDHQIHGKAWNVMSICKLQWGLWQKVEIGNRKKNSTTNPKPRQTT